MHSHNNNYDLNLNHSFMVKILLKIIFLVVLVVCLIFIMFSNKENKIYPQSEFEYNNDTQDLSGNDLIIFETNDYIVYKKIERKDRYFTQGLFMDTQNTLIESSGLYGQSTLQKYFVDSPDEKIFKIPIERQYFAEGACIYKEKIYQLTWRERVM